jgi:NADH dehydrogenase/NADH:ubiquinone oxidoreductase subunit G
MTPRDLLAVSPEFLAKAILHRRENIVQSLPPQIAKRQEERQIAANLAKDSRAKRDDLISKVSSLKKERNDAQTSAKLIIAELKNISDANSENQFDKLRQIEDIKEIESDLKVIENLQSEIVEHKDWASKNVGSKNIADDLEEMRIKADKLLESGKKAHIAMMELSKDNKKMQSIWLENESHRRRCESRYTKLARCKKESESAVEFWSSELKGDFSEMLTDSVRVSQGGPSSRSLMKQSSGKKTSRRNN